MSDFPAHVRFRKITDKQLQDPMAGLAVWDTVTVAVNPLHIVMMEPHETHRDVGVITLSTGRTVTVYQPDDGEARA